MVIMLSVSVYAIDFSNIFQSDTGKAALIELDGQIQTSSAGGLIAPVAITPEQVRDLNRKAENQNVDAIVYEINSGGGAVVASKDVMRSIDSVEVPTVCRFKDIGASGAYMAALGCDKIVADSATFTGSIGVTGSYLEYTGLMEDLGIGYVNLTAGERKELGSPFQETSEEELELLRQQVDSVHEEFYTLVDDNRNLTDEQLEEVRTGQVFLGQEAQELGLVDELGGRAVAFETAENISEKEQLRFTKVEKTSEFGFLDLLTMSAENFFQFTIGTVSSPLNAEYGR